ncbi:MAG: acyl carrier protein [Planctomycetota bacterium]
MEIAEILAETEKHFGFTIADDDAQAVRTVEDLYRLVMRKTTGLPSPDEDRLCRRCGYNLRGTGSTACPECASEIWLASDENAVEAWKQMTSIIADTLAVKRESLRPGTRFIEDLRVG